MAQGEATGRSATASGGSLNAHSIVPNYGPEIRVGVRAVDARHGVTGVVSAIADRCHWSCHEGAEQWRPRAAYLLRDGERCDDWWPEGQRVLGGYVPPEHLFVVPSHWQGIGLMAGTASRRERLRPFCGGVLRHLAGQWWLMNTPKPTSSGLGYPSLGAILAGWDIQIVAFGRDELGVFAAFEVTAS